MTLRWRLGLLFSGLLVALALGSWWGIRELTADLAEELGDVAVAVGRSVVAVVATGPHAEEVAERSLAGLPPEVRERVRALEAEPATAPRSLQWVTAGDEQELPEGVTRVLERHLVITAPPGANQGAADLGPTGGTGPGSDGPSAGGQARFDVHLERISDVVKLKVVGADGAVRGIPVPQRGVDAALADFSRRLLTGGAVALIAALVGALMLVHRATAPLARLAAVADRVAQGELGSQVGPVRGAGSEVATAIAAFDEMSRRLAELEVETRQLREREHLGELGEVARGIAHSLRNPLHAVGLSVDRLARCEDRDEAMVLAGNARSQIRRLDGSIRSFLAFAADGVGDPAVVDLARLCRDVALEAAQDAAGRVRIEVVVEAPATTIGGAIAAELRAIVQALVVNAVEASPDGQEVRVEVVAAAADRLQVRVLDRGPGVAASVQEQLFAPHVTTKATGSGMGLFIARRLAQTRYDGEVELAERNQGGTVARAELARERRG
jgi:signal transduction histidine kinase